MATVKTKAKPKKKAATSKAKPATRPKTTKPKIEESKKVEPTLKEVNRVIENLKKQNSKLRGELDALARTTKAQQKQIASLEGKMETRTKREDIFMTALEMNSRSKKGDAGAIDRIGQSLLTTDEHVLKYGKRMENMLSALKNHREYLIKLNKKVYKIEPAKKIEMELKIIRNTLSIMALCGFNIDKALFGDMKRINKMMEKEDSDLTKVQKRMAGFKRKFDEEMEKFDFDSIFKKSDNIPGYR
ncbi:MAG: hypothetical protein Q7J68_02640 [Thermoplasmata archaeon]|nr:hypothetical protein [Thermoplasmata archaeon]